MRLLLDRRHAWTGLGRQRRADAQGRLVPRHPSPPAVRMPSGEIVTPGIIDAERLQGFDPDWTLPSVKRPGVRPDIDGSSSAMPSACGWRRGRGRLSDPIEYDAAGETPLEPGDAWPSAAWGRNRQAFRVHTSTGRCSTTTKI